MDINRNSSVLGASQEHFRELDCKGAFWDIFGHIFLINCPIFEDPPLGCALALAKRNL